MATRSSRASEVEVVTGSHMKEVHSVCAKSKSSPKSSA